MSAEEHGLSGVQETLLIPLSARVLESRRADSSFSDPHAERIARAINVEIDLYTQEWTNVEAVVGRTHILDQAVRTFLAAHPGGQVFNLGAGLCTRFFRIDDGRVRWTDIDLPDVITLKGGLVEPHDRYRLLAGSVLEKGWMSHVEDGPVLFIAEGLLMYFAEAEVASLLRTLAERFSGSRMSFEAVSPLLIRVFGRRSRSIQATGATLRWGLRHGSDVERLAPGVRVTSEEYHTEVHPERWGWLRVFKYVRPIHCGLKIVHVELG